MTTMFKISARFILTVLGFSLLAQSLASVAMAQVLLPDTEGKLDSVVVSVNSARRSTLRNASLITNIVNALPDHVHVSIVTNDRTAFTVARNRLPKRVAFVELDDDNPITIWPQDPFLVLSDIEGRTSLLKSNSFERSGDDAMADEIASSRGFSIVQSSLNFEGGNVVSDEKNIFIGANTIRQNASDLELSESDVVRRFEDELGKRVLVVGPYPQPSAHIDMYITPLGDGELLVADADWGADIVQKNIKSDPSSIRDFEDTNEKDFFGNPQISSVIGEDGFLIRPPDLSNKTSDMVQLSRDIAPILDGIADAFAGYGYKVHRVPFLFGGPETVSAEEHEVGQKAAYPMLTYNNALIENHGNNKTVYLPVYDLESMDVQAADVWRSLGYKVQPVRGFATSSMYGGALRCSVKVLKRPN